MSDGSHSYEVLFEENSTRKCVKWNFSLCNPAAPLFEELWRVGDEEFRLSEHPEIRLIICATADAILICDRQDEDIFNPPRVIPFPFPLCDDGGEKSS